MFRKKKTHVLVRDEGTSKARLPTYSTCINMGEYLCAYVHIVSYVTKDKESVGQAAAHGCKETPCAPPFQQCVLLSFCGGAVESTGVQPCIDSTHMEARTGTN